VRNRHVEEIGGVAIVVLTCHFTESDLHQRILIIDQELFIVLGLLPYDQLRGEMWDHLFVVVSQPVFLHIVSENLGLLRFLKGCLFFLMEEAFHILLLEKV
jgi:hypothetical protein